MSDRLHLFEGSSFELGTQHAALVLAKYDEVRRALYSSVYWRRTRRTLPIQILQTLQSYGLVRSLQSSVERVRPAAEYLDGMLSYPGMTRHMLYFLLLTEVLGADRSRIAQGCSGIGCWSGQRLLVGKNFDYQYPLAPYQGLLVRKETSRYRYVAFSPLLMPFGGQLCMNEHGLTISYNYAYSRRGTHPGGLPASYLVHEMCRGCRNTDEAVSLAQNRDYPIGNGASLAVADPQNLYLVEVAGDSTGVLRSQGTLVHTNHFLCTELTALNFSDSITFAPRIPELKQLPILESSRVRLSKLSERVGSIVYLEDLQTTLAEETDENGMNNVFQTGPFWGTISSYIAIPSEMTVYEFKDIRSSDPTVYNISTLLSDSLKTISPAPCSQT